MRCLLHPKSLAIGFSNELAMCSPSLKVSATTSTARAFSSSVCRTSPRTLEGRAAFARDRHERGASKQRRALAEPLHEQEQRRSPDQHPEPIAGDPRGVPIAAIANAATQRVSAISALG